MVPLGSVDQGRVTHPAAVQVRAPAVVIVRGERHAANLRLERAESRADVVIRTTTSLTGHCVALLRRSSGVRVGQVDQVDRMHVRNSTSLVPGDCWDLGQGSSSAGQSDGQGEDVELHGGYLSSETRVCLDILRLRGIRARQEDLARVFELYNDRLRA